MLPPRSVNSGKPGGSILDHYRGDISRCVKCGSCRAVCPAFLTSRDESLSPRGRMALIRAVLDGRLGISRILEDRLESCTSCLACEAACSSSVPVCDIIQAGREQAVREAGAHPVKTTIGRVLQNRHLMQATAWLAPFALHYPSRIFEKSAPTERSKCKARNPMTLSDGANAKGSGRTKGKVVFFPGCAVSYLQPSVGLAAIEVLQRTGFETIVPAGLKCCGRPFLSLGNRNAAEECAAQNVALFTGSNVEAVVTPCASCALTFKKEYSKLLPPGTKMPALLDLHEVLAREFDAAELSPLKKTITWHDPCHLGRGQGLASTARRLLNDIPGVELVEMKNADSCCGFGGIMRVTHAKLSDAIAREKIKNILAAKAASVVTGCPGCMMQIRNGLRQAGSGIQVIHTVQLFQEALANSGVSAFPAT